MPVNLGDINIFQGYHYPCFLYISKIFVNYSTEYFHR
ncbi:unnamed protein product, partial [marine sediment metagenome]